MKGTSMTLHRGAQVITREELDRHLPPAATESYYPIGHSQLLDMVTGLLDESGFQVTGQKLALTRTERFFATLDLQTVVTYEVNLAVGILSSYDKSTCLTWLAGEKVWICDNRSYSASTEIKRRHTRYSEARFREAIAQRVTGLHQYRIAAEARINRLRDFELTDDQANSLVLQAWERKLCSHRNLPKILDEYRDPRHEQFEPRNAWSLLNAFTEVYKERAHMPAIVAANTISLQALLDPQGADSPELMLPAPKE